MRIELMCMSVPMRVAHAPRAHGVRHHGVPIPMWRAHTPVARARACVRVHAGVRARVRVHTGVRVCAR
jgi:hypothetical protein